MPPITQNDILFALSGAVILYIIYRFISVGVRIFITRSSEIKFHPEQIENVLQSCYRTFPVNCLSFNGTTYSRGMSIRITTDKKTIIEGQFIGTNYHEMLCLVTDDCIVAQEIGTILEIKELSHRSL